MAKLSHKKLQTLKIEDHGKTLREDGGIVGRVRGGVKGVTIAFRYEYKFEGKKKDYALGSWPKKSLFEIRAERDRVKVLIAEGIEPNTAKKVARVQRQKELKEQAQEYEAKRVTNLTVNELFESWLLDGVARQDNNAELKRLFAKDVLPIIGDKVLSSLNEQDIRTLLRRMLKRGISRLVVVTYNDINQMLTWAEKRQPWRSLLIDGNPCDLIDINRLLPSDYEEERDRILLPDELVELKSIFEAMQKSWQNAPDRRATSRPLAEKTQIALWLCLSTLSRIGELLMARWEHVDIQTGTWYIPRENVKGGRGKKQEHYVFLSSFAKNQFKKLKAITGNTEWCFPSKNKKGESTHVCLKSVSKQVGDRQVQFKKRTKPLKGRAFDNSLVLSGGMNGAWTPHDLRRTGATMMQQLGVSLDIIDRCQNHILAGSRVRRHYLHHDYKEEKTEAWQLLADKIEEILNYERKSINFDRS